MILLKANAELQKVFQYLINSMMVKVVWNGIFVVNYNSLILPGNTRSLFFDFENKKVYTNIVELNYKVEDAAEIGDNDTLANALNMTLYVFGKWGLVKGLKVEKNYAQLNRMFGGILKETGIEPGFREDNFRFSQNGIQFTYEDVLQEVLKLSIPEEEEQEKGNGGKSGEQEEAYRLGLWHNMKWLKKQASFQKAAKSPEDKKKARIGNNFSLVDYKCPCCGEKIYIVLYPVNKEFLVETEEGRVYLARAYACNQCNSLYTPRPEKLLVEGDIYELNFEDDRGAFEDYLELLGRTGTRDANYKFNEFEAERNKEEPESLEEACSELDALTEAALELLREKMEEGFYPDQEVEKYYKEVEEQLQTKKGKKKAEKKEREKPGIISEKGGEKGKEIGKQQKKENAKQDYSMHTIEELRRMLSRMQEWEAGPKREEATNAVKDQIAQKQKEKYEARMRVLERMSAGQLKELRAKLLAETELAGTDKANYLERIDEVLYQGEEQAVKEKVKKCQGKSYAEISRVIESMKDSSLPDSIMEPARKTLYQWKREQAKKEVENLMSNIPDTMDKKQYQAFRDKLAQYEEADLSPYEKQLEEKQDLAERQEISNYVKRANKRDRSALIRLSENLREQGFKEENMAPYLKKIHDKIYEMDRKAMEEICPDVMDLNFQEALEAYEKISAGVFLPELKINMLEVLDRRLTWIKEDEGRQLVRKFRKSIEENIKDASNIYFYSHGKAEKEDPRESFIRDKAVNTYGRARGKYEYPVMVCDASKLHNGKEGFILTPDHIFYNSLIHNGAIQIRDIERIEMKNGIFGRGIYLGRQNGEKCKLPVGVSSGEWEAFARVLGDFINYLQERPESRSISYLAEEKHEKKCCYRCGYVYMDGDICPKCGSKFNS